MASVFSDDPMSSHHLIFEKNNRESPICELCRGNGYVVVHCEHCDFSSDGDLICFRCQSDEGSSNGQVCPRCEREAGVTSSTGRSGSSDEGNGKYPVDAVVKIQVNDRTIDVDSDETPESESSGNYHPQRGAMDRLDTIVETKGDTASENDEENGGGTKLNDQTQRLCDVLRPQCAAIDLQNWLGLERWRTPNHLQIDDTNIRGPRLEPHLMSSLKERTGDIDHNIANYVEIISVSIFELGSDQPEEIEEQHKSCGLGSCHLYDIHRIMIITIGDTDICSTIYLLNLLVQVNNLQFKCHSPKSALQLIDF
ncbi:hypothetical protein G5I_04314 [Acromyrmex echinatior]|uniref:Uncharacterized protein n=1 Tax=Acromyrmex echinatior TaxID=103372 RepID=F4WFA7_ACREC|nr:hypothetical protein G5I_04314 [Acromyrmex echinatior]